MGISKLFKEKSGAPGGDKPAAGQDNVANEANFEDEHGNWVLTEAEAWKLAAALAAAKNEEEFQAALSGILAGRIFENYFDKNQFNQKTTREKDQKARAEMYYIAILQAQIEALDAQIADLTNKIDNFEGKHFTADEQTYFDSLPPEDRFTAKDKAMQARLAAGEITQDEYDRVNIVDAAAIACADVIHAGIHGGVFSDCLEAFEQTIEIRIGLLQSESLNAVAV